MEAGGHFSIIAYTTWYGSADTYAFYETRAREMGARYDGVVSPYVGVISHWVPVGAKVLDVGCGSGRDVRAMMAQGYEAYGLEPSGAFIQRSLEQHPEMEGRLVQGSLPEDLGNLGEETYDALLLSAVIMHIPEEELFSAALALKGLLKPGGKVLISHCPTRPGLDDEGRDAQGRLFCLRTSSELLLLFERLGFAKAAEFANEDSQGRQGIRWETLVLEYQQDGISESVDRIETIIHNDKKTASYKLALLKALCQIAQKQTALGSWLPNGRVQVPLAAIADLWIEYYLPLVGSPDFLPQNRGEHPDSAKPIAFRSLMGSLLQVYEGTASGLAQFVQDRHRQELGSSEKVYESLKKKIANTIRVGPIQYTSGETFAYDAASQSLVLDGALWRELVLLGHWIEDSLNIQWARLTQEFTKTPLPLGTDPGPDHDAARESAASGGGALNLPPVS
jgi:SAM-dependent methyltransferase